MAVVVKYGGDRSTAVQYPTEDEQEAMAIVVGIYWSRYDQQREFPELEIHNDNGELIAEITCLNDLLHWNRIWPVFNTPTAVT